VKKGITMSFALTREGIKPVAKGFALALALFQIWFTTGFGVLDGSMMRVMFVSFITVLVFLFIPCRKYKENEKEPTLFLLIDLCCAGLAIATAVYFALHLTEITTRMRYIDDVTPAAKFFAAATVLLVLEITRRTTGWALVIVASTLILYAFFGDMLPRAVKHTGFTFDVIVEHLFLLNEGVYGIPIGVATSTLFGFIMFGAFLERSKMSSIFMDLACLLTRNSQGGPAKVAIFASALFGTISGSAAANVYGTGTFTIPLMKKVGYTPHFAGAVEAVASTGGQMMPPIMGAAAFIMADVIGVSYLTIAKAALIPSVLYYLTLLAIIHLEAVSKNMGTLPPELVPSAASVLRRLYYLFPLVFLITILLMGRSVIACAYYGTVCIVILSMIRSETRFTFKRLCGALELSAKNAMMVSSCCACAGIIIGVISLTGIGYKFINVITALAGSNLLLLMAMLMVTCIILGMGVPTAPAYIIVATLGAPALMKAGVPIIAAHMFVYFYAILSVITPPVCLAAFAGAAIAETNAMKTGVTAMKLGIVAFIIPFMFVFEPALLMQGSTTEIATAFASALIGVIGIASGMQNWLLVRCRLWERALLLASGLMLIFPGLITDTIGLSSLLIVLFAQRLRKGGSPIAAA
jgi:TRAP transporter 4TM/12TM fusion protein